MIENAPLAERVRCTRFPVEMLLERAAGLSELRGAEPAAITDTIRLTEVEIALVPHFDASYYKATNPEVGVEGFAALRHFVTQGAAQRRWPAAWFDTGYYLDANPDVAAAGVNPFWHYLMAGAAEGRRTSRAGGYRREVLDRVLEPHARTRDYPRPPRPRLLTASNLDDAVIASGANRRFVLSVSHDVYLRATGGIQLFIAEEQRAFAAVATNYLQVSPFYPSLLLGEPTTEQILTIVLNGRLLGQVESDVLATALRKQAGNRDDASLVVHSLLGHDPSRLVEWQRALGSRTNVFWLHDYASVCPGYNLLRNDITFCGAPPIDSQACRVCIYGEQRRREADRYRRLFAQIAFTVASPSRVALAIWRKTSQLAFDGAVVHPHCEFDERPMTPSLSREGKIRLAFVGYPSAHKGWPLFRTLTMLPGVLDDYEFFHFAIEEAMNNTPPTVKRVSARTSVTNRAAMSDALAAHMIDLVLLASPWPETFSYSLFESLAAGVDVLTTSSSGNIADVVLARQRGLVADDEPTLVTLVADRVTSVYAGLCRKAGSVRAVLRHRGTTATLPTAA